MLSRNFSRVIRQKRIRKKISGSHERPRFSIFRSNLHFYGQVIDDSEGKTMVSASDVKLKKATTKERAKYVGETIAKLCLAKKIKQVVFDRGGYKYHGLIKVLTESAREKGLKI